MSRRRGVVALATAAVLLALPVTGCFSQRIVDVSALPEDCQALARAANVPAGHVVIGIKNFAFVPSNVEIDAGDTVTWVNCDSAQHTATSDSGVNPQWGSPLLPLGQTYSRQFTAAGTIAYHCAPHPSMKATLVVQ